MVDTPINPRHPHGPWVWTLQGTLRTNVQGDSCHHGNIVSKSSSRVGAAEKSNSSKRAFCCWVLLSGLAYLDPERKKNPGRSVNSVTHELLISKTMFSTPSVFHRDCDTNHRHVLGWCDELFQTHVSVRGFQCVRELRILLQTWNEHRG